MNDSRAVPIDAYEEGLPSSVHTEVAILGAMMLDPAAVKDAIGKLKDEDFSLDSHKRIYRSLLRVMATGADYPEEGLVWQDLKDHRELDAIGGPAYLMHLTAGIPRNCNIASYVRIVKDKSLLRQLIGVFRDGQSRAGDQSEDALSILQGIKERFSELEQGAFQANRNRNILVGADDFLRDTPEATEWAVEGLIQRGGNGIIVGDPGSAKSFSTLDLAHHLVAGVKWMGHNIPRRMKVAYIAREDHAGLTQQRGLSLLKGYAGGKVGWALADIKLNEWLYYNTRTQSESFSLQNQMDVQEIIEAFKKNGIEMAFFDVFRRLWEGDENDNREVAKVLAVLTRIQTECNCSVALVHHLNKSEGGTIFQRIRGAGSIYGWREWAFGISIENPEDDPKDRVRKMVFETKAATPANPVYYNFDGDGDKVILAGCAPPAVSYKKGSKTKKGGKDEDYYETPWYDNR